MNSGSVVYDVHTLLPERVPHPHSAVSPPRCRQVSKVDRRRLRRAPSEMEVREDLIAVAVKHELMASSKV